MSAPSTLAERPGSALSIAKNRLAEARTVNVSGPALPQNHGGPTLHFRRLHLEDGLNRLPVLSLILESDAADYADHRSDQLKLTDCIGKSLGIQVALDTAETSVLGDAGERFIHGMVIRARHIRNEGPRRLFEFELSAWLYLATLRTNWRIFQNASVREVLADILKDYSYPVRWELSRTTVQRDYVTQAGESDYDMIVRQCAQHGIAFYFEYADNEHRLVLTDETEFPHPRAGFETYPYHPAEDNLRIPHIFAFERAEQLRSGRYATSDYDLTRPNVDLYKQRRDPLDTAHNNAEAQQEVYEFPGDVDQPDGISPGPYPSAEIEALTRLRMEQLRSGALSAKGQTNIRSMAIGDTFTLTRHPTTAVNTEHLVTALDMTLEDNGRSSGNSGGDSTAFTCTVNFNAQPLSLPWRPHWNGQKPIARGPQIARVVGDSEIWTDDLGRVRVEFPWHRAATSNSQSTCWLRVAQPIAGGEYGGQFLPRQNQEVIVDFIDGDYDKPIITGRVYNQSQRPPWQLPEQIALSGFRTKELGGDRNNFLIFDDTHQAPQVQLSSDHALSQLNLGSISHIKGTQGRTGRARGVGAELRSNAKVAVRGQGLFLTTYTQVQTEAHHTDMPGTAERLQAAHGTQQSLTTLAEEHQAQQPGEQSQVVSTLKTSHDSITGAGAGPSPRNGQFPELAAPHLVCSSAADTALSSSGSTHIASGEHLALTANDHIAIATHKSLFASVREAIKLFAYNAGIRLLAASGNIDIHALTAAVNVLAKLEVKVHAGRVVIQADDELILQGGASRLRLADTIESSTPGGDTRYAARHSMGGPKGMPLSPLDGEQHLCSQQMSAARQQGAACVTLAE